MPSDFLRNAFPIAMNERQRSRLVVIIVCRLACTLTPGNVIVSQVSVATDVIIIIIMLFFCCAGKHGFIQFFIFFECSQCQPDGQGSVATHNVSDIEFAIQVVDDIVKQKPENNCNVAISRQFPISNQ